jgi:nucleotide sugar dehydrogenase
MNICVVGLGKIGLPIALQCASRGHRVIGADIDPDVVQRILNGKVDENEEPGSSERLSTALELDLMTATTDTASAVSGSQVVVVVVPLIVDASAVPDFTAIDAATSDVARGLRPDTLVSYETTLPIGTTRSRLTPALAAQSGLTPGRDLFVCHSPERVFTGRVYEDLRRYPKLVGGIDESSAGRGCDFYSNVLEFDERPDLPRPNGVWKLDSCEAAEFTKLAETTYRDVNIALANQFAIHADELGIDSRLIIEAANSQPYSHIHSPGIAVGGHCIPVYPRLYLSTDPDADIVSVARSRNEAMPTYAVEMLRARMGSLEGTTVAVLGAAYRGGVKETAFSGVFPLVSELERHGAKASVHDPLYSPEELEGMGFEPFELGDPCDAAVIQADHPEYETLGTRELPNAKVVVDGRGQLSEQAWRRSGVVVLRIGSPDLAMSEGDRPPKAGG